MSIHNSLRTGRATAGSRSVLTRWERVLKLKEEERWEEGKVYSLPKVRVARVKLGAKKKTAAAAEGAEAAAAAGTEGAAAAPAAAAAAPAAGKKDAGGKAGGKK